MIHPHTVVQEHVQPHPNPFKKGAGKHCLHTHGIDKLLANKWVWSIKVCFNFRDEAITAHVCCKITYLCYSAMLNNFPGTFTEFPTLCSIIFKNYLNNHCDFTAMGVTNITISPSRIEHHDHHSSTGDLGDGSISSCTVSSGSYSAYCAVCTQFLMAAVLCASAVCVVSRHDRH